MRRWFEQLEKGDLTSYLSSYPTIDDAKRFVRLYKKVCPFGRAHIRRGNRVAIVANNRAESWLLTISLVPRCAKEMGIEFNEYEQYQIRYRASWFSRLGLKRENVSRWVEFQFGRNIGSKEGLELLMEEVRNGFLPF